MRFFSKSRKHAGYMAVGLSDRGVFAVSIAQPESARPSIDFAGFYPALNASLSAALERLSGEGRVQRHRCGTVLEPEDYQLLSVEAPSVPADELRTAIRWRLKDMLDYRIDDATIDVLDVPLNKEAPGRNPMLFAVSARNQVIRKRQALFAATKIPLSVIDVAETAQRNLAALIEPEGRALAMLSFGHKGGLLTITFGKELHLARRIDVSTAQLAEPDDEKRSAIHDRITLELQRSIDHFDRQHHGIALSKLMLAPLEAGAEGLRDYLAANLYTPVEIFDLESVIDLGKVPELKPLRAQQEFFLTIGAALRVEEAAP